MAYELCVVLLVFRGLFELKLYNKKMWYLIICFEMNHPLKIL